MFVVYLLPCVLSTEYFLNFSKFWIFVVYHIFRQSYLVVKKEQTDYSFKSFLYYFKLQVVSTINKKSLPKGYVSVYIFYYIGE